MSKDKRRSSDPIEVSRIARDHRRKIRHERRPCGSNVPQAPTGLAIDFDRIERARQGHRYRAKCTWDEVTQTEAGASTEVDRYIMQFQFSPDGVDDTDPPRRFVVAAKDDDANMTVTKVVHRIRKHRYYRFRVRAVAKIGKSQCRGDWSAWTSWATPSDTTPPPAPTNVRIKRAVGGIRLIWDEPDDADDSEVVDEDVAYYQAELHTNSSFTARTDRDRYIAHNRIKFDTDDDTLTYYGRVRSVDAAGNKSAWIPATAAGNSSSGATPDGKQPKLVLDVIRFTLNGDAAVQLYKPAPRVNGNNWSLKRLKGRMEDSPAGAAQIWDLKVNGASRFSSDANRLQISAGGNEGSTNNFTSADVSDGDHVQLECLQVGSTTPGGNGIIELILYQTS